LSFAPRANRIWAERRFWTTIDWLGVPPPPGTAVQIYDWDGRSRVLSADGQQIGTVVAALNLHRAGVLRAQVADNVQRVDIVYLGPNDLFPA
jgi:hypothetical protein